MDPVIRKRKRIGWTLVVLCLIAAPISLLVWPNQQPAYWTMGALIVAAAVFMLTFVRGFTFGTPS